MRGATELSTPAADAAHEKAIFAGLSNDAKGVLGAHFGMMIWPGKGHVTFQTPWNRSERGAAALDELVAAGVLSVEEGTQGLYAWTYRALLPLGADAFGWVRKNLSKLKGLTMMVADSERRERPPRGWASAKRPRTGPDEASGSTP